MSERTKFQWTLGFFIYVLAAIFLIYEMALQVSPSIMTDQLMVAYSINAKSLGIMASFYFYSYTLMQIPVGLLFDRYGPRLLISGAAMICAAGALFFGLTGNIYLAAIGRFFMGIGSAFAFVGVLVVATRWFPPYYFAFLVGIAQLLAAFGALGGELPLAALVNEFGWRTVMVLSGLIGVIIALFCAMIIRNHPSSDIQIEEHDHHLWKDLKEILHSSQTWWIALYAFSNWGPNRCFCCFMGSSLPHDQISDIKYESSLSMLYDLGGSWFDESSSGMAFRPDRPKVYFTRLLLDIRVDWFSCSNLCS